MNGDVDEPTSHGHCGNHDQPQELSFMSTRNTNQPKKTEINIRNNADYIPAKTVLGGRQIRVNSRRPKLRSDYAGFKGETE
jgi:hypothetical protein